MAEWCPKRNLRGSRRDGKILVNKFLTKSASMLTFPCRRGIYLALNVEQFVSSQFRIFRFVDGEHGTLNRYLFEHHGEV
jgi:hypothetical protein